MKDIGELAGDRVLVFGGPYSNLAATQAIMERAGKLGISADCVICTGDMVAYCAEPVETLDIIRDWKIPVVMGNCEESLGYSEPDCGCGFESGSSCSTLAIAWYRYADRRVSLPQRHWMQALPRSLEFQMSGIRFRVVHGSDTSINEFVFASSDASAKLKQIDAAGVDVIIGGHSGIPFGQAFDNGYWLNAGVIGMPANDATPHGWYMVIENVGNELIVSWHSLEYDFETSAKSTIAAGMSEYGEALKSGLWPSTDILPDTEANRTGLSLDLLPLAIPLQEREQVI